MAKGMLSDLSPQASVAIGILVGLLSTCVQSVGLTLQRKSHMLEDEKANTTARPQRPPYLRRRWQIGMLLFLIANIVGSTIQITTLPLPLLSTLQASGLVFNSLLATLLLHEAWTWKTASGTVLVAGGAVLISFFSAVPEPSHNLRQLLELLHSWNFLVWFILSLVFVCAILVMDFTMRKCVPEQRGDITRIRLVRGMSYGMCSGILSAHALLLAKSAVELIVRSVADGSNQFSSYQSWLLILAFVILALAQLYYLHLGLKLISTSILYPFVFCIYNIVAILDGLIYFRQMDRLPPLHAGLIALGTVVLLSGVLALSWRFESESDGEQAPMAQSDIPQTLLAPGSGFVADPADEDSAISAVGSEDDDSDDEVYNNERARLLGRKTRAHSRTSRSYHTRSPVQGRRPRRAHTLRDVSQMWHVPDNEDKGKQPAFYGTFTDDPPSPVDTIRPSTVGHPMRSSPAPRRASYNGKTAAQVNEIERAGDDGGENTPTYAPEGAVDSVDEHAPSQSLQRANTTPCPKGTAKRRSRSGQYHYHDGGALFSELLSSNWWRGRARRTSDSEQKADDATDDEDGDDEISRDGDVEESGRRSRSSGPISGAGGPKGAHPDG